MNKKGDHAKTEQRREHVEKYQKRKECEGNLKEIRRKERPDRSVVPSLRRSSR